MLTAFLLLLHTPIAPEQIDTAARGLNAAIEDDIGGSDTILRNITTRGCESVIISSAHQWAVDWRNIETLGLEQNFIFIKGAGVKFAIVADVSKPDQKDKLTALAQAMADRRSVCGGAPE